MELNQSLLGRGGQFRAVQLHLHHFLQTHAARKELWRNMMYSLESINDGCEFVMRQLCMDSPILPFYGIFNRSYPEIAGWTHIRALASNASVPAINTNVRHVDVAYRLCITLARMCPCPFFLLDSMSDIL